MPSHLSERPGVSYTSKRYGGEGRARYKRKTRMSIDMRKLPSSRPHQQ